MAERAGGAPRQALEPFFRESAKEVLIALAGNPHLEERDLLRLLERKDLSPDAIRIISGRTETSREYSIKLAIARHPRTPRLISLPLLKYLYVFDLLRVVQTPAVPADVKVAAEDAILKKAQGLPRGERITLARRASGRVVAGLLVTNDRDLIQAGLENPFLTEAHLLKLLTLESADPILVEMLARHPKWSRQYYVRLALLRNPATPVVEAIAFLPNLAINDLREICVDRRMPEEIRKRIVIHCSERMAKQSRASKSKN